MAKKIGFLFLTFIGVFLTAMISARADIIDESTAFAGCNYATNDGKYAATFYLYKFYGNNQAKENMLPYRNIKITKFDGKAEDDLEENKNADNLEATALAIVTGECPKYLAVAKTKAGYYAAVYNDYNSANGFLSGHTGAVLNLTTDYLTTVKAVENFHKYFVKNHTCGSFSYGICTGGWSSETTYTCDYGNGLSRTFAFNFKGAVSQVTQATSETATNGCPTVAYEIIKNGQKYYKYTGDWPNVCSEKGVSCYKYIYGVSKEAYQQTPEPPKPFVVSAKYATKNSITWEYNSDDILELIVSGKNDGTIDNIDVRINGQVVSLASYDHQKFKSYFANVAKTEGAADLPDSFSCGAKDKIVKDGYTLNNEFSGLQDTATFCTDTTHFGYSGKMGLYPKHYYKMDQGADVASNNLRLFMDSIDNDYSTECNEPASDKCKKFQKNAYDQAVKYSSICKKIYADMNSVATNIQECDEFYANLSTYATSGYFGNRVISGNNGTDCKGILGSLGDWLSRIYNVLKLAVPALIVALGFKDFIQGMSSGKDDALKKAGTNFIKRLVVGAVFVMLPILIKMILTFAFGGSFSDICITL